jgi:glycosyltransferase involved in cell wall biosynthesis
VRVIKSGSLPDAEVHRLYAAARLVVFPSFYEGFGFPIVTALAYGKTLIARQSELLEETAGCCPASAGRLITFTRRDELVEIVGRLLHGEASPEAPVGAALSGRPRTWHDVASDIITFMDRIAGEPERSRWIARERAVNQLLAFRA